MVRSVVMLLGAAVFITACQGNSGAFSKRSASTDELGEPGIPATAATRFSDVPLPKSVHEDMERSYIYESRSLQIGRMIYTGKYKVSEVAQFYIEEAPKYNWKLTSVLQAEGAQLAFEKPGRRMWITIQKSGVFNSRSTIIINVVPEADGARTSTEPLR